METTDKPITVMLVDDHALFRSGIRSLLQRHTEFSVVGEAADGVGFDVAAMPEKGENHVGLHIMRERAQRIDATFDVHAAPGRGTTIELHLPREQRRAA